MHYVATTIREILPHSQLKEGGVSAGGGQERKDNIGFGGEVFWF